MSYQGATVKEVPIFLVKNLRNTELDIVDFSCNLHYRMLDKPVTAKYF